MLKIILCFLLCISLDAKVTENLKYKPEQSSKHIKDLGQSKSDTITNIDKQLGEAADLALQLDQEIYKQDSTPSLDNYFSNLQEKQILEGNEQSESSLLEEQDKLDKEYAKNLLTFKPVLFIK